MPFLAHPSTLLATTAAAKRGGDGNKQEHKQKKVCQKQFTAENDASKRAKRIFAAFQKRKVHCRHAATRSKRKGWKRRRWKRKRWQRKGWKGWWSSQRDNNTSRKAQSEKRKEKGKGTQAVRERERWAICRCSIQEHTPYPGGWRWRFQLQQGPRETCWRQGRQACSNVT